MATPASRRAFDISSKTMCSARIHVDHGAAEGRLSDRRDGRATALRFECRPARTVRDAVEQLQVVVNVVELVDGVQHGQDDEDDEELEPLRVVPGFATGTG